MLLDISHEILSREKSIISSTKRFIEKKEFNNTRLSTNNNRTKQNARREIKAAALHIPCIRTIRYYFL